MRSSSLRAILHLKLSYSYNGLNRG
jgi:hypothetical protein